MSKHRDNTRRYRVVIAGLAAVLLAVLGMASSSAHPADADSVTAHMIADNAVGSPQVRNGSLRVVDTNTTIQNRLTQVGILRDDLNDNGDVDDEQTNRLDALENVMQSTSDPTTVTTIGGSFGKFTATVNATLLDTVTLEPGTYVLTGNLFTTTNAANDGDARMQLALRVDDGTDWGQDFGTAFTGTVSPLANREATASTTRVVEVTETTDVLVYAFGYEDDQGGQTSGLVDAWSYVTAQQVG